MPKPPTGARRGHTLVANPVRGELLLFGGLVERDRSGFEPLWSYSKSGWRQLRPMGPRARSLAGCALNPASGVKYIYGGLAGGSSNRYGDLWSWDGSSWREIYIPNAGPGPRDHHAMAFDDARGNLVIHGGSVVLENASQIYNDTWLFNGNAWTKVEHSALPHRAHHAMIHDPIRKHLLAFGGITAERQYNGETWTFDGVRWTMLAAEGPPPLARYRMAFHPPSGQVILYGGNGRGSSMLASVRNETRAWDGTRWRQLTPSRNPGPRFVHAMAYYEPLKSIVLYGGVPEAKSDDAWIFDGADWKPLA